MDPLETSLPDYSLIEKKLFSKEGNTIRIGKEELTPQVRDILREQARYILTSQLWEILNASITNEAIDVALIQSKNFDHTQFGKALWHYSSFMRNIVLLLSKD